LKAGSYLYFSVGPFAGLLVFFSSTAGFAERPSVGLPVSSCELGSLCFGFPPQIDLAWPRGLAFEIKDMSFLLTGLSL
jgi:hypothetical protein